MTSNRFDHLELPKGAKAEGPPINGNTPLTLEHFLKEAGLGWCRGDFERSLRNYSKALEMNHDLEEAWVGQTRCLLDLDEVKEARLWSNKGLDRLPRSGLLMGARALAIGRMSEGPAAMEECDRALSLKQDSWYLWVVRGTLLLAERSRTAEYCFIKALELEPQDPIVPLRIGMAYLGARDYHRGLPHLRKAAQGDPTNPLALWKYGLCLTGMGWPHQAVEHFQAALGQKSELRKQVQEALETAQRRGPVQWLKGFWNSLGLE